MTQRTSDTAIARDVQRKASVEATEVGVLSASELKEASNYASLVLQAYGKAAVAQGNDTKPLVSPSPKPEKVVPGLTAVTGGSKRKAIISVLKLPGGEVVLLCEHGPNPIEVDSSQSLQVPITDAVGGGSLIGGIVGGITGGRAMVHRNFGEAFEYILENKFNDGKKLKDVISSVADGDVSRITCVGHGLGGAVATIAAYWCAKSAFPKAKVSCITYGAPLVGNKAFADEFNSLLAKSKGTNLRFIHKIDALTAVPDESSGFTPTGAPVFLTQPDEPDMAPAARRKVPYEAQLRERDLPTDAVRNYVLEDNYMTRYQSALWSAMGKSSTPLKDPAQGSMEQRDALRLYDELQEFGSTDQITLMSTKDLQECFLYSQVAFLAYEDSYTAIDAKFDAWLPWMSEDLWGQVVHARRLHASEKLGMVINTDTEAIVMIRELGDRKAEAIVGFRGTETGDKKSMISDVYTDLKGFMVRLDADNVIKSFPIKEVDNGVRVHEGFAYSFEDLINPGEKTRVGWDRKHTMKDGKRVAGPVTEHQFNDPIDKEIMNMIHQHSLTLTKVTCVGHSLGAALATLGAYYFKTAAVPEIQNVPVHLINFGSPRVGNPAFAKATNSKIDRKWRVMNRSDPVTMVAWPVPPVFDYYHIEDPILLAQPLKHPYGVPPGKNNCPPVPPCPPEFAGKILRAPDGSPQSKDPQNNAEAYWGTQVQLRNRPPTLPDPDNVGRDHGMQHYQQGMNAALNALGVQRKDGSPRGPLPLDSDGNLLDKDGKAVLFDKSLP